MVSLCPRNEDFPDGGRQGKPRNCLVPGSTIRSFVGCPNCKVFCHFQTLIKALYDSINSVLKGAVAAIAIQTYSFHELGRRTERNCFIIFLPRVDFWGLLYQSSLLVRRSSISKNVCNSLIRLLFGDNWLLGIRLRLSNLLLASVQRIGFWGIAAQKMLYGWVLTTGAERVGKRIYWSLIARALLTLPARLDSASIIYR